MYPRRFCFVAAAAVAFAVVQAGSLPAGDVTVDSGAGTITGDQDDNEIALYSDGEMVWVEGREGTTINGGTEPVSFGITPSTINILMGDGDDAVDVRLALAVPVGLNIQSGGGADEVVVKGGEFWSLNLWTDSMYGRLHDGDDDVKIEDVTVMFDLKLYTYGGKDEVVLRNTSTAADGSSRTTVDTHSGHDTIVIDSIVTVNLSVLTSEGNDLVELRGNSILMHLGSILLGDGCDVLDTDGSEDASFLLGGLLDVFGQKGHDTLINQDYFQILPPNPPYFLNIDGFEVIDD